MSETENSVDPFLQLSPEEQLAFGRFCANALRTPQLITPILTDDDWFMQRVEHLLVPKHQNHKSEQTAVKIAEPQPCNRICCRTYNLLQRAAKFLLRSP